LIFFFSGFFFFLFFFGERGGKKDQKKEISSLKTEKFNRDSNFNWKEKNNVEDAL
jgi:hypothetical protein